MTTRAFTRITGQPLSDAKSMSLIYEPEPEIEREREQTSLPHTLSRWAVELVAKLGASDDANYHRDHRSPP